MGKDLNGKELGVGLSQRKDSRYSGRFTRKNGKREEYYDFKLANVKKWLNDKRYEDEHGLYGDGKSLTVEQWFWIWIKSYKEDVVTISTCNNYKYRFKQNICEEIGYMYLGDVKKNHCQSILKTMNDKNYAYGTINQAKITLRALFDGAVAEEYLIKNPAQDIKCPKREVENERRVLTQEEQTVFLEYSSKSFYYNAHVLLLQTGLRIGELSGLQWKDIDFDKKNLNVKRTLLHDKGKDGFYFAAPKTKNSIRTISLTERAIQILRNQKIELFKYKMKSKSWNDKEEYQDLIFRTHNGSPIGASSFRINMIRIIKNINNDRKLESSLNEIKYVEFKHIYPHSLRHTYATRCIENGMTPKVLQKILGHSTITVTMDLYVHVLDEKLEEETIKFSPQIEKRCGVKMA